MPPIVPFTIGALRLPLGLAREAAMFLHELSLQQFRNYREGRVGFDAQKTILVGKNAQGKSNLLEAIELLATLKSNRAARDGDLVHQDAPAARIEASAQRAFGPLELALTLRKHGRRTASLNGQSLQRQLDFLGSLNAVTFSNLDLELVRGSPEARRRWLDALLVQLEPVYAHLLQQYNRVLRQRNALLQELRRARAAQERPASASPDWQDRLAAWDAQLTANGARLMCRRARILQRLAPLARDWHASISNAREALAVAYAPNVSYPPEGDPDSVRRAIGERIAQRREAEMHQGRTVVGPHRDEIALTLDGIPARQYGSQGQQRTLVLSLKLAELQLIEQIVGEPPLLLLDDVLAELDPERQDRLLAAIQARFQTLITATHLQAFDVQWQRDSQVLTVEAGRIERA